MVQSYPKEFFEWDFLVEWKNQASDWKPLKDLKRQVPSWLVEYAVTNEISEEHKTKWLLR